MQLIARFKIFIVHSHASNDDGKSYQQGQPEESVDDTHISLPLIYQAANRARHCQPDSASAQDARVHSGAHIFGNHDPDRSDANQSQVRPCRVPLEEAAPVLDEFHASPPDSRLPASSTGKAAVRGSGTAIGQR